MLFLPVQVVSAANDSAFCNRVRFEPTFHLPKQGAERFEVGAKVGATLPVFLDIDPAFRVLELCMFENVRLQGPEGPFAVHAVARKEYAAFGLREADGTILVEPSLCGFSPRNFCGLKAWYKPRTHQ